MEQIEIIKVYTPQSPLKTPARFIQEMFADLIVSRELAWALTTRDFKAQFRQSLIGYAWAFLPPLVASLTFLLLQSGGAISFDGNGIPYFAFVIIGTLLWQVFVDSLNNPIRIMGTSKQMLTKINFPREALIVSALQISLINLGIRLIVLVPFLIYMKTAVSVSLLLVPIGLLSLVMLGLSIGIILAPLAGLYQDVQKAITMIVGFWMFLTPVVFSGTRGGILGKIVKWNPVTSILSTTRDWMTNQPPQYIQGFWIVSGLSLIFFIVGWLIYRIVLARVIERMGM